MLDKIEFNHIVSTAMGKSLRKDAGEYLSFLPSGAEGNILHTLLPEVQDLPIIAFRRWRLRGGQQRNQEGSLFGY